MKLFKKEINLSRFKRSKKDNPIKENKVLAKEHLEKTKKEIATKTIDDTAPIIIESKEGGLKSKLDDVSNKLDVLTRRDVKTEQKELGLPYKIRKQLKKLAVSNKVLVLYLSNNRTLIPQVHEIKDEIINVNGKPHAANASSIFLWNGKYPSMIVPEWDLMPLNPEDSYKNARDLNRLAEPVAVAIRMMENSQNPSKPALSNKAWVFIGLAVIAGIYVLVGG